MTPFDMALEAWMASDQLRRKRERFIRYTYGRQWDDPDRSPVDGSTCTEFDAAVVRGLYPQTNNLIRQLLKSIIGNFRSSLKDNPPLAALPEIAAMNDIDELDCRLLEEFLISGVAVQRVCCERRPSGTGTWIDNINPADFFVNRYSDPRGIDIDLIGMLHSMSLGEVLMRYANTGKGNADRIMKAFNSDVSEPSPRTPLGHPSTHRFFNAEQGLCRIIEVWTLESHPVVRCHDRHEARMFVTTPENIPEIRRLNARRAAEGLEPVDIRTSSVLRWHCRIYLPDGELLDSFVSPYKGGGHPFVVKMYPLVDGEVHSLVEDVIGQQRHINSLITLIDQIMRVSAKGVLLFPIDQKIDTMSWTDLCRMWQEPGGIIPYDAQGMGEPRQMFGPCDTSGAYRLLQTQLDLFQKVSGVSDVLQGHVPDRQTSAALFESQLRSSAVALLDLLDTFNSMRVRRDRLVIDIDASARDPDPDRSSGSDNTC
ncbi:MAG: hypothetical protein NC111_00995 [Bacteroides sp.]|nr:hypothetical protein [Bacteroides sp.]MCM1413541.1 hypothetical protein [Bacteroides sp.]MCM1471095.1 hypothetical protein [Bacteroides sp.]